MRLLSPVVISLFVAAVGARQCLPSGDETQINRALEIGGPRTTVELCPGSVHRLKAPIVFNAPYQTLTTAGGVKDHDRALIIVEGDEQATAIRADCKQCDYATISSLIIDGNRPILLRVPKGEALIALGNAEGQRVTHCRLFEPRGWSALHVREGDALNCRKVYVADNVIGPCGEEWDEEYDGWVEKEPVYGNPRADGISVACKESIVERNTVFDTTDGAIVLFGAAGSTVRQNKVSSRTRVVLGGVNLVDYDPFAGDYTGVKVHDNDFYALSRFFKAGVVVGPSSWSDDTDTIVHGGTIVDNRFHGEYFGYGVVVSSAEDFTVLRNVADPGAKFSGVPGPTCPTAPENGKPTAFLINRHSAKGKYQSDFVNGEVQHIICINPEDFNGEAYKPWRLRDSPEAVAAAAAAAAAEDDTEDADEKPELAAGLDARLAEALVTYQATLMAAMTEVEQRLDASLPRARSPHQAHQAHQAYPNPVKPRPNPGAQDPNAQQETPEFDPDPDSRALARRVTARLAKLEGTQASLHKEIDLISRDIAGFQRATQHHEDEHRSLVQRVLSRARAFRMRVRRAVEGWEREREGREQEGVGEEGQVRGQRGQAKKAERGMGNQRDSASEEDDSPSGVGGARQVILLVSLCSIAAFARAVVRKIRADRAAVSRGLKTR